MSSRCFTTNNSPSYLEQQHIERLVQEKLDEAAATDDGFILDRYAHIMFCRRSAASLPACMSSLDCSRSWLCYWSVHSLAVLNSLHKNTHFCEQIIDFCNRAQCESGGFGGGPNQLPHLAPTYALIMSLVEIGTPQALTLINRAKLYTFIMRRKTSSGGFQVHEGGEVDIRATYCALASASMCNVLSDDMKMGVGDWLRSCQTYEGGFGGEPGNEAHGGYAYCGLASLLLLGELQASEATKILKWACHRQMSLEGGFQGRTNKLVDSCYSFWVGAIIPLLDLVLRSDISQSSSWLFNRKKLQAYLLACCQSSNGGLKDKPNKNSDLYHTCYSLSGIAIAQNAADGLCLISDEEKPLRAVNALYNVCQEEGELALRYFAALNQI